MRILSHIVRPGRLVFVVLALVLMFAKSGMFGQAGSGFVKIGSTAAGVNTYTDSMPVTGQVTNYEVTAVDSFGRESGPSNILTIQTPNTSVAHSNTIGWTSTFANNVYAQVVPPPNPPTALSAVSSK